MNLTFIKIRGGSDIDVGAAAAVLIGRCRSLVSMTIVGEIWAAVWGGIAGAVVGGFTSWGVALDARRREMKQRYADEWHEYLESLAQRLLTLEFAVEEVRIREAAGEALDESLEHLTEVRHSLVSKIKGGYMRYKDERGDILTKMRQIVQRLDLSDECVALGKELTRLVTRWRQGALSNDAMEAECARVARRAQQLGALPS